MFGYKKAGIFRAIGPFPVARDKKLVHNFISLLDTNGNGGIAQLGERLHGMQEVSGSIPLTSTKSNKEAVDVVAKLFFYC